MKRARMLSAFKATRERAVKEGSARLRAAGIRVSARITDAGRMQWQVNGRVRAQFDVLAFLMEHAQP